MSIDPSLIRILAVDDHPLLRKGIAALVNTEPDMELIAEASNGQEAIQKFRSHHPDMILMGLQMPSLNGIEAIERILSESPETRIIVLTTYSGDGQVFRALKAGEGLSSKETGTQRTPWKPFALFTPGKSEYLRTSPQNCFLIPGTT
jgi:DNA-binding NarL/FixJ family response regulator